MRRWACFLGQVGVEPFGVQGIANVELVRRYAIASIDGDRVSNDLLAGMVACELVASIDVVVCLRSAPSLPQWLVSPHHEVPVINDCV